MISVNLNEIIKVKFTDYGRDIYYHRYDSLIEWAERSGVGTKYIFPSYPEVGEDGYSEIQLWEFMQVFGSYIHMGMREVVTEGNCIYLDETGRDFKEAEVPEEKKERKVLDCTIQRHIFDLGTVVYLLYDDGSTDCYTVKCYGSRVNRNLFIGLTEKQVPGLIKELSR